MIATRGGAVVIKKVGSSGKISLQKEAGDFIPDSERWLHAPEVKAKIEESLEWMR
jgi:hypothetical protein